MEKFMDFPPVTVGNDERGECVKKTGPWALDLGGIAKGFAVDQAVERVRRALRGSNHSGCVNAGGDLRVWGDSTERIRLRAREPGAFFDRIVEVSETAVATSSLRDLSSDDLSPAIHLQMPAGIPCRGARTATVFANRCLIADALTKIALSASTERITQCLAPFSARALIFGDQGALWETLG